MLKILINKNKNLKRIKFNLILYKIRIIVRFFNINTKILNNKIKIMKFEKYKPKRK